MIRTLKGNNAKPLTSRIDPNSGYNTVPLNRCFVGIVHPNTTFDLKDASGWVPVEKYPSKGDLMPGEVGKLDEVRFVETSNAKVFSSSGAGGVDVYATIVLGKNAYGISRISGHALRNIVKPLGSAGTADPLEQRATSGWKATFITKILQQAFMGRIEHGVTA